MQKCAEPSCDEMFEPNPPHQKYHHKKCRLKAMNRRHRNPAKNNAYARKRYAENREAENQKLRDRYAANPEKYKAKQREYYHSHRETVRAIAKRSYRKFPVGVLIQHIKRKCRKENIPFDLTAEWGRSHYTGACEISGLFFKPSTHLGPNPFSPSIDRIDPKKGYIQTNCRVILHALNAAKGSGTDEDLKLICESFLRKLHC